MSSRLDIPVPTPISGAAADPEAAVRLRALNDEAWSIRYTGRERADTLAREALALAEAADDPVEAALALRTLGARRFHQSDVVGALSMLERALSLLDGAGERRGRADVLTVMGGAWVRRGEYARGAALLHEALELQRTAGDRVGEAISLNQLGHAHYLLGDYGRALEYYHGSLALREQAGDREGVGYCLNDIGIIHAQLGEMDRVLDYFGEALAIHETGDPRQVSICLANIGNAHAQLGDDEQALQYLRRASDAMLAMGDHVDRVHCLLTMGEIHERRGEDEAALAYFHEGLALTRRVEGRIYEPEALIRLGPFLGRHGEPEQGLAHLRQALRLAEASGARQQAYAAHQALAALHEQQGDMVRALEHFRAYHDVWSEVFGAETDVRIRQAIVGAEMRQSQREAELLREKNQELARADREKAELLEQVRRQAAELERQTREDALTGVANRRHLDEQLAVEWERALRFGRALTVAMADVDHFKQVNDRFSHAVGDEVLRVVGRILRESMRGVDVVARYGGEEFCLLLVETPPEKAAVFCERLRAAVEAHDWPSIRPGLAVTLSFGVAGHLEVDAPDALVAAADARLYAAKRAGRNRVCGVADAALGAAE